MTLSPEQYAAINCDTNNAIIAIPGSGKTRVLTEKCKRLIGEGEQYILVLSFTRASSVEVRERIELSVGEQPDYIIQVATFHKLLMDHLFEHGFKQFFLDESSRINLIHQLMRKYSLDNYSLNDISDVLETSKPQLAMQLNSAKNTTKYCAPSQREKATALYEYLTTLVDLRDEFYEILTAKGMFYLNTIIDYAMSKFYSGELPLIPIDHLLIDEFQDADGAQIAFALLHANAGVIVTVVGDDDQSIYAFREAKGYEGFKIMEQNAGAKILTLSTNYRSHAEIIDSAFKVVEKNKRRIPKSPISFKGEGGSVSIENFNSVDDEHEYIISHLQQYPDMPTLIISRTRYYLKAFANQLDAVEIPYSFAGDKNIFDKPYIHQVVSMLTNLNENNVQKFPNDGHVLMPNISEDYFAPDTMLSNRVPSNHIAAYSGYCKAYLLFKQNEVNNALQVFFKEALSIFTNEKNTKVLNIFLKSLTQVKGTLKQRILLVMNPNSNVNAPAVTLMTMHGSKGLESPRVFVIGCNQGHIPMKRAITSGGELALEEERRLLFVAMTRAEKELHLTSFTNPTGKEKTVASEFLIYLKED
jgi:DNA helicase-2/ATP-dependent DNA helicase PcrA